MLLLKRKLLETIYAGYDLDENDAENTFDVKLTITRIVDSFDKPRVYAEVAYRDGTEEQIMFTPARPKLEIHDMLVKLVSIRGLVDRKTGQEEKFVNLGFEAPDDYIILRAEKTSSKE